MLQKKSTILKNFLLVSALSATVFAIGCGGDKKESSETPATSAPVVMDSIPPAPAPVVDTTTTKKVMDTASIRPTKTPTKAPAQQ